jgi:hypothetical protein
MLAKQKCSRNVTTLPTSFSNMTSITILLKPNCYQTKKKTPFGYKKKCEFTLKINPAFKAP